MQSSRESENTKVLIIEGSGLLCQLIESSPVSKTIDLTPARSFQAAVNAIQGLTPDLILIDLDLPGKLNVAKACILIKRVPRCKNVPMYIIGTREKHLSNTVSKIGAQGHYRKPISPARFLSWFQALPSIASNTRQPEPEKSETRGKRVTTSESVPASEGAASDDGVAPRAQIAAPTDESQDSRIEGEEKGLEKPAVILLVDGGITVLELLREAEAYKYAAIVAAGSAQEAGILLKAIEASAVFIEADLPDLRGEDLCSFLNSVEAYKDIPIFMMSEDEEEQLNCKLTSIGAAGFLQKPFNGDDFVMFLYGRGLVNMEAAEQSDSDSQARDGELEIQPAPISQEERIKKAIEDETFDSLASISLSGNLSEQVETIMNFGREKKTEAVPILIHILSGANTDLIGEACWALGEIGDPRAIPELVMILKREETFCVLKAVEALGKIGDSSAVPHIVARASQCGDELKIAIVRALAKIGGTMSKKGLEILSLDENFAVSTMAQQVLSSL